MKKILFAFGFVAISALSFGQSCSTKRDEITGKEQKSGRVSLLPGSFMNTGFPMVALGKTGDDYVFEFVMKANLGADNFDKERMACLVKFADGTIKKFLPNNQSTIVTNAAGVIVALVSDLNKADLDYIKTNPITFIRFSYKGDESIGYDNNISEKKAKQIMKSTECVL